EILARKVNPIRRIDADRARGDCETTVSQIEKARPSPATIDALSTRVGELQRIEASLEQRTLSRVELKERGGARIEALESELQRRAQEELERQGEVVVTARVSGRVIQAPSRTIGKPVVVAFEPLVMSATVRGAKAGKLLTNGVRFLLQTGSRETPCSIADVLP